MPAPMRQFEDGEEVVIKSTGKLGIVVASYGKNVLVASADTGLQWTYQSDALLGTGRGNCPI